MSLAACERSTGRDAPRAPGETRVGGEDPPAVVVDEGQDFFRDWWIALEMINSGGETGAFYVFFDPDSGPNGKLE